MFPLLFLSLSCKKDPPSETDTALPPAALPTFQPYATAPSSSLPSGFTSCPIIAEEQCSAGSTQVCTLLDSATGDWATDIPAMTEQAFYFDRYYDLYHQANGISMDIDFTQPVLAGTPESEWSKDEYFKRYDGRGDSSGWTGTALWGAASRYAVTGTASDYQRMLDKTESMVFLYEINGIPGMVSRSHFAMLEEGAPDPVGHWNKSISSSQHR